MSKKLINLLRHGSLPREDDGAIEFWRRKEYLRNHFVQSQHWSDEKWKSTRAKGGGNKKIFQYCTDPSGEILCLRALQGHSGRNLIDPSLQDNVKIPNDFFEYIYHIGCAIILHSIHEFRIDTGRTKLEQKTDSILSACGSYEQTHKDPDTIDLNAPRHAQYMHNSMEETSKHGVLGRYQACSKERIKVLSDSIERHHPLQYTHSLLYPEGFSDGNWSQPIVSRRLFRWKLEISYTKKYMNHLDRLRRFSFKDNWRKELGSEVSGPSRKLPTNPTKDPQIQFTEQGDLLRQNKSPVRVLRESTHVSLSLLTARIPI